MTAPSTPVFKLKSADKNKALKLLATLRKDPKWSDQVNKLVSSVTNDDFLKMIMSAICYVGSNKIYTMVERLLSAMALMNWTADEIIMSTLQYNDKVHFPPGFLKAFPEAAEYAYNVANPEDSQTIPEVIPASSTSAAPNVQDQLSTLLQAAILGSNASSPASTNATNASTNVANVDASGHGNASHAPGALSQTQVQALLAALTSNQSANGVQQALLTALIANQSANGAQQASNAPQNAGQNSVLNMLLPQLLAQSPSATPTTSPSPNTTLISALVSLLAPPHTPPPPTHTTSSPSPAELLAQLLVPSSSTSSSPPITLRTPNIHKHHAAWPTLVRDDNGKLNDLLVHNFLKTLTEATEMRQDRHHYQVESLIGIAEYIITDRPSEALRYISNRLSFLIDMEEHGPDHAMTLWNELRGTRTDPPEDRHAHLSTTFKCQKPPPDLHRFLQQQLAGDKPSPPATSDSPTDHQRPGGPGRRGRRRRY